jgi:hypothetical protein
MTAATQKTRYARPAFTFSAASAAIVTPVLVVLGKGSSSFNDLWSLLPFFAAATVAGVVAHAFICDPTKATISGGVGFALLMLGISFVTGQDFARDITTCLILAGVCFILGCGIASAVGSLFVFARDRRASDKA